MEEENVTNPTPEVAVVVDDSLNLNGAPHTICEIGRESLSMVPEKTDEELYAPQPEEEKPRPEKPSLPNPGEETETGPDYNPSEQAPGGEEVPQG